MSMHNAVLVNFPRKQEGHIHAQRLPACRMLNLGLLVAGVALIAG